MVVPSRREYGRKVGINSATAADTQNWPTTSLERCLFFFLYLVAKLKLMWNELRRQETHPIMPVG